MSRDLTRVMKWKAFEFYTDDSTSKKITHYKGPYGGRTVFDANIVDIIIALSEIGLYSDYSAMKNMTAQLQNSPVDYEKAKYMLRNMSYDDIERTAAGLVNNTWTGDHHWGHLFSEDISTKTFVTEYLFRMINSLADYENYVDTVKMEEIEDDNPHHVFSTKRMMEIFDTLVDKREGRRIDEYLVEKDVLSGKSIRQYSKKSSKEFPRGECQSQVEDTIAEYRKREKRSDFISNWKELFYFGSGLSQSAVFGNWHKRTHRTETENKSREITCLSEAVVGSLASRLGELYDEFMAIGTRKEKRGD